MFLVTFCAVLDDLPLALFPTLAEAEAFGRSVTGADDPRVRAAADLLGRDTSTEVCVTVVRFEGGLPDWSAIVREFDAEPATALD
jgi:hypothetical protein